MSCKPPQGSVFLVTGSTLRAEEMDRPLAYYIREHFLESRDWPASSPVHVISDFRFLYETKLAAWPTISVGGPGVNALTHKWLDVVPLVFAVDEEFYIHLAEDSGEPTRACIWGVDHVQTKIAVATFIDNYLPRFLTASLERAHRT